MECVEWTNKRNAMNVETFNVLECVHVYMILLVFVFVFMILNYLFCTTGMAEIVVNSFIEKSLLQLRYVMLCYIKVLVLKDFYRIFDSMLFSSSFRFFSHSNYF